jgi:branched-subunit amino acid transport protein
MTHNTYIYILIMALATYAVRVLPLTLIQKQIKNKFLRSFLYYVPYVTLAVMTFPAILDATQSPISGAAAIIIGIIAAWLGADLFAVAVICCGAVLIAELILPLMGLM